MLQTFAEITTDKYFEYLKTIGVIGLGPWKDTIAVPDAQNYIQAPTDLVARAHAHGLQVACFILMSGINQLSIHCQQGMYIL